MRTITLKLPDELLGEGEMTDAQLSEEIRMLAAVKLYEMGRISSGRAAELAGLSRIEFLERLGRYNVSPFQITPEELKAEVEGLRADLGQ
jgi:predicted HTH domain antitoxin